MCRPITTFYRSVGAGPRSQDGYYLLWALCNELRAFASVTTPLPTSYGPLCCTYKWLLSAASEAATESNRSLVMVLDNVSGLDGIRSR